MVYGKGLRKYRRSLAPYGRIDLNGETMIRNGSNASKMLTHLHYKLLKSIS